MVRTGIVGLGYWGPNLLRNFASQKECQMAWGCDLKEQNFEKLKRLYPSVQFTTSFSDLLSDDSLELILIATPSSSHFPLAKQALEAGKNVFLEKPMTVTLAEAEELQRIATEKKKKLFVDHTFVFSAEVRKMAELVKQDQLGKLLYFDSIRINLGLIQKDINALWDLAIHDLSILNTCMDLSGATSVCAHGSCHFGSQEENVHLHITFASGFTAHIHVSWVSPVKVRRTVIGGTKAMVIYDDTQPSEKLRIYDRGIDNDVTKPDPFNPVYRSGDILIPALPITETLAVEAQHVLECVAKDKKPLVGAAEGMHVVRLLESAQQSLRNGSIVIPL